MAILELNQSALRHNFDVLDAYFKRHSVSWGIVTKILCGTKVFLKELNQLNPDLYLDSRLSNLARIKSLNPNVQTAYIKPPAKRILTKLLEVADISFNTQFDTLIVLNELSRQRNQTHKVVIMIELGELREGVMRENAMNFFTKVFELEFIRVIGLGTNLNCMNGILPTHDKLYQLVLIKQLIESKFNRSLPILSGGTSVVLPLIEKQLVPKGINHFRIGETLFFGNDLLSGGQFLNLREDVFTLRAEVIEVLYKPTVPSGERGMNLMGEINASEEDDFSTYRWRVLLDLGVLDIDPSNLIPEDSGFRIDGASSDILALDLDPNATVPKVGDLIGFKVNYMGALRLMGSYYIEKRVVNASGNAAL